MPSHYLVTVQPTDSCGAFDTMPPLQFGISNHDDLFAILTKVETGGAVPLAEAPEFVVGLKLFLEVMIRHRQNALFKDLWPHMSDFMKRLKAIGPRDAAH
jgi:hypothetical protein